MFPGALHLVKLKIATTKCLVKCDRWKMLGEIPPCFFFLSSLADIRKGVWAPGTSLQECWIDLSRKFIYMSLRIFDRIHNRVWVRIYKTCTAKFVNFFQQRLISTSFCLVHPWSYTKFWSNPTKTDAHYPITNWQISYEEIYPYSFNFWNAHHNLPVFQKE